VLKLNGIIVRIKDGFFALWIFFLSCTQFIKFQCVFRSNNRRELSFVCFLSIVTLSSRQLHDTIIFILNLYFGLVIRPYLAKCARHFCMKLEVLFHEMLQGLGCELAATPNPVVGTSSRRTAERRMRPSFPRPFVRARGACMESSIPAETRRRGFV
jgi:hypothetical protein